MPACCAQWHLSNWPRSNEWGDVSFLFAADFQLQNTKSTINFELNGGNSDLWGRLLRLLKSTSKNLLFFSKMVGRVGIEPTTN